MYNECRHIFTGGRKCGSPALKGQSFCYFHNKARERRKHAIENQHYSLSADPKATVLSLPTLDDPDNIQLAISEITLALAANCIDPRRARILLYGCQIASQHYRHKTKEAKETAQEGGPLKPSVGLSGVVVREVHEHTDGTEIGPEKQSPDPEDLPEPEEPMTLGRYLMHEAIKLGYVTEERARENQQEYRAWRKQATIPKIEATADQDTETQQDAFTPPLHEVWDARKEPITQASRRIYKKIGGAPRNPCERIASVCSMQWL